MGLGDDVSKIALPSAWEQQGTMQRHERLQAVERLNKKTIK